MSDWPKVPLRYDSAIDRRVSAGWVRRRGADDEHRCPFPTATAVGDLWRCFWCRKLWQVGAALGWSPASWWLWLRYLFAGRPAATFARWNPEPSSPPRDGPGVSEPSAVMSWPPPSTGSGYRIVPPPRRSAGNEATEVVTLADLPRITDLSAPSRIVPPPDFED